MKTFNLDINITPGKAHLCETAQLLLGGGITEKDSFHCNYRFNLDIANDLKFAKVIELLNSDNIQIKATQVELAEIEADLCNLVEKLKSLRDGIRKVRSIKT